MCGVGECGYSVCGVGVWIVCSVGVWCDVGVWMECVGCG